MKKVHEDKRYGRQSLMAINVANEVIDKVRRGQKINLTQIQVANGYTLKSATSSKAIRTKTYQEKITSVLDLMEAVRLKSLLALNKKDHNKEKYRDLTEGVDKFTKNTQLLSGKATENVANNIVVYGTDDWLALQKAKEGSA